jgi:hypothetical protein
MRASRHATLETNPIRVKEASVSKAARKRRDRKKNNANHGKRPNS